MYILQLNYATWARLDANGLFDYQSQQFQSTKKLKIQQTGYIYRNQNTFQLFFVPKILDKKSSYYQKQKLANSDTNQIILKIIKTNSHYQIQSSSKSKQQLSKIVTHQTKGIHKVQENDILRVGKVQIQVMSLIFNCKKFKNRYQEIKSRTESSQISKITQITTEFYDKGNSQSQSIIQDNPTCRYCHCKTLQDNNPFIISCSCKGYTKYVHQQCLVEWILKRGQLKQIKDRGIYYVQSKLFKCQLCNQFFNLSKLFQKIFKYKNDRINTGLKNKIQQLMILYFKQPINLLFFIDLSRNQQICIGRSLQSDIILNQLSVSRKHAYIKIDNQNKTVTLKDNQSKFGTLVDIKRTQIQYNQTFQVGRSKITFNKYHQKSFFQYFGLCVTNEKLRTQRKKQQFAENKKKSIQVDPQ